MKPSEYKISTKISLDKTLGYMYFCDKSHPLSDKYGKTYYHRHVASVKIGRWLTNEEIVHHVNGIKDDNSVNNIEVMTESEHANTHMGFAKFTTVNCSNCNKPIERYVRKSSSKHITCSSECKGKLQYGVDWPENSVLTEMLSHMPATEVGKILGVSSSSLKKHCKKYSIPTRERGYWRKLETMAPLLD